jgi:hypothetical protein
MIQLVNKTIVSVKLFCKYQNITKIYLLYLLVNYSHSNLPKTKTYLIIYNRNKSY